MQGMGRKNYLVGSLCSILAIAMGGCGSSFPPIGNVTRIEVHDPNDHHIRTIEDPTEIGRIVAFVNSQQHGWGAWGGFNDWFGLPVPDVIADFYENAHPVREFGVGPGYFEEGSVSKLCSDSERLEFLSILGVPPCTQP
jgi:hypothetical protein